VSAEHEAPEAIVGAVRALVEYEASMADYVALARRVQSSASLRRLAADRARLAGDRRRVRHELRAMLVDYTAALRAGGVPPERMVILIKSLAERALGPLRSPETSPLRADLLLWAIESYYAAPAREDLPVHTD
jgi:hypothetical protein